MCASRQNCLPSPWLRFFIALTGGAVTVLGILVLIGWNLHLPALVQLRPTLAPMQYNTALCFLLAGMALNVWAGRWSREAVPILGAILVLIGGLTMAENSFHTNLGIDQLFFHTYIAADSPNAGRMSPVSAFCFTLAGLAFIALEAPALGRPRPLIIGSLASVIVSITLMALLGYAFGLPTAYGWGHLTRIAMHTSIGIGLVGASLFFIAWNTALHPGERTPRWVPIPVVIGVLAGSLVLYFALQDNEQEDNARTVKADADGLSAQVALRMEARIRSFVRMARHWEVGGLPSQASWQDDAASYLHDFPEVEALEWMDENHLIRWVVPVAGNEDKLNLDLTTEPNRKAAVDLAERTHNPAITGIVNLFHGGRGFVVYVPIMIDGKLNGLVAAVFKAQPCLARYLPPEIAPGEAIRISEGGHVFYQRDAATPPVRRDWVVNEKVRLPGATWDMSIWPNPAFVDRLDSPLPELVLCVGILGSLLLGGICFLAQRASRHTGEIERANTALHEALDNVKTLQGLLPICSCCKRVRDDTGYWSQIDTYIRENTNASLSHGYCPECAAKTFQQWGFEVPENVQAEVDAGNYEKAVTTEDLRDRFSSGQKRDIQVTKR